MTLVVWLLRIGLHSCPTVIVTRMGSPLNTMLSHPCVLCTLHTFGHPTHDTPNSEAPSHSHREDDIHSWSLIVTFICTLYDLDVYLSKTSPLTVITVFLNRHPPLDGTTGGFVLTIMIIHDIKWHLWDISFRVSILTAAGHQWRLTLLRKVLYKWSVYHY